MSIEFDLKKYALEQALNSMSGDQDITSYDDLFLKAMSIADTYILPWLYDEFEWELYAESAEPPHDEDMTYEDLG